MSEDTVENGNLVKADYIGKLESGEVFDSSKEEVAKEAGIHNPEREYQPLEVKVGSGQIIPGFEEALVGMKEGEKKEVTVQPEEGYGYHRDELYRDVDKSAFEEAEIDPQEGMVLETEMGIGVVDQIKEEAVTLNFNHPLAGNTLKFEIEVVEIVE